jgi:SAM-dependent methyltransferase
MLFCRGLALFGQKIRIVVRATRRLIGGADEPECAMRSVREKRPEWYYATLSGCDVDVGPRYAESSYYFLYAVIVDRVRRSASRRVLEIGSGLGRLAGFLLDQGVQEYVGLDFSPKAVAIALRFAPRGRFVVGDARTTTLHEEVEHDIVICTEVLEHIEEDLLVVSRFRPGKRCICSVPNFSYESHVRYFRDAQQVAHRYGPFFGDLDVMTFESPSAATDRFFLFDGTRNDYAACGP